MQWQFYDLPKSPAVLQCDRCLMNYCCMPFLSILRTWRMFWVIAGNWIFEFNQSTPIACLINTDHFFKMLLRIEFQLPVLNQVWWIGNNDRIFTQIWRYGQSGNISVFCSRISPVSWKHIAIKRIGSSENPVTRLSYGSSVMNVLHSNLASVSICFNTNMTIFSKFIGLDYH